MNTMRCTITNCVFDLSLEAHCYHHGEDDLSTFSNFTNQNENYTNSELYKFFFPLNDDLPYVFDTYDFDYCYQYDSVDFLAGLSRNSLEYRGHSI